MEASTIHAYDIKNDASSSHQSRCCKRENVKVAVRGEALFLLNYSSMLKKLLWRKERAVTTTQTV